MAKTLKWLQIIGIGEEGFNALTPASQQIIERAEMIFGGKRHLAMLPATNKVVQKSWATPLEKTINLIKKNRGKNIVVLASGDPMDFGIGITLARHFADSEMNITPFIGSFSHALAVMGWARHETHCLTLHGRTLNVINPYLQPKQKLLLLADDGDSPKQIADMLRIKNFGTAEIHVLSHLGSENLQTCEKFIAQKPPKKIFPDLSVIAVTLPTAPNVDWYGARAVSDEAYHHDGKITKFETRAATLAKLKPAQDAILWDLGAGSGAVAIEWARGGGISFAVERNKTQCAFIADNIKQHGNDKIMLIKQDVLKFVAGPPKDKNGKIIRPDAIFIGGGISEELLEAAYRALAQNGRLVANAVTLQSQEILFRRAQTQGALCRLSVARMENIGAWHGFKPLMEVVQFFQEKGE